MSSVDLSQELKAYWAPGCTSCLRMKEFLKKHNVKFTSINIVEDPQGLADLEKFGIKHVPIAMRGKDWADGQVLADVARVAGIAYAGTKILPPDVLYERASTFLTTALNLIDQIPSSQFKAKLPNSPRSFDELTVHIFQIAHAYVECMEKNRRLEGNDYLPLVPPFADTQKALRDYCEGLKHRFDLWWQRAGARTDYTTDADVNYGKQTVHEFLERTTWHAGQHTRQLQAVVESLGLIPNTLITEETLADLPMPANIYDDQMVIA